LLASYSSPTFATKSANCGLKHRSKLDLYSITSSARAKRQRLVGAMDRVMRDEESRSLASWTAARAP
jgi:hypothetical protein